MGFASVLVATLAMHLGLSAACICPTQDPCEQLRAADHLVKARVRTVQTKGDEHVFEVDIHEVFSSLSELQQGQRTEVHISESEQMCGYTVPPFSQSQTVLLSLMGKSGHYHIDSCGFNLPWRDVSDPIRESLAQKQTLKCDEVKRLERELRRREVQLTRIPCRYTQSDTVPDGWRGKNWGTNFCNECVCKSGKLICSQRNCTHLSTHPTTSCQFGEGRVADGYIGPGPGDQHCNACTCKSGVLLCTNQSCASKPQPMPTSRKSDRDDGRPCKLEDGEEVPDGWGGLGRESNKCNTCRCASGLLLCSRKRCKPSN
eukprot:comp55099_c0_seq1/m.47770 comp55099_c0_seq1/g.47770  ORF comp55099_c0_seq1/g.47770 comp55099_c0_seq1/m.47770 type:complete len:315 (-) comp55099_c0_seq1:319-1263(-)